MIIKPICSEPNTYHPTSDQELAIEQLNDLLTAQGESEMNISELCEY